MLSVYKIPDFMPSFVTRMFVSSSKLLLKSAWVSNSANGVQSNGSTSSSGSSAACSVAVCTELLAVVCVDAPQPVSNDVDNSIAVVIAVNCFTFSYLSAMILPPIYERTFAILLHY